ncbi:hypothetical protein Lal_00015516 [Lupinus albus]|nr:hypothetical protein Lal_00015516 [Lupinus albus]
MGNKVVVSKALVKAGATNLIPKVHVKRGDLVMVISGTRTRTKKDGTKLEGDKGKIGKVLKVFPKLGKVVVEGVNVQTDTSKPRLPTARVAFIPKKPRFSPRNPSSTEKRYRIKMIDIKESYDKQVREHLKKQFNYSNDMQIPRVVKVVVNMGMGESTSNSKAIENGVKELQTITGQKPVINRARKSIATFKLRKGMPVGASVTLRGKRMWNFLAKLIHVSLPRIRDFRGISPKSFDGRGNYSLGVKEQLIFPEINYENIDAVRGMDISIVTTARTDQEAHALLAAMGMPFKK